MLLDESDVRDKGDAGDKDVMAVTPEAMWMARAGRVVGMVTGADGNSNDRGADVNEYGGGVDAMTTMLIVEECQ